MERGNKGPSSGVGAESRAHGAKRRAEGSEVMGLGQEWHLVTSSHSHFHAS